MLDSDSRNVEDNGRNDKTYTISMTATWTDDCESLALVVNGPYSGDLVSWPCYICF